MFSLPTIIIPIWALFIPFGIIVSLFVLYGIFNVYHLLRFATYSFGSYLLTSVFIGGAIIIGVISAVYLSQYDWSLVWNFSELPKIESEFSL
jgi:hypothetical protein